MKTVMGLEALIMEELFANAEELLKNPADYYHRDAYGKCDVYAIANDPQKVNGCIICLVKFLDDSPVMVRYYKENVHYIE